MELNLYEHFMLLALDNKKGKYLIDSLSLNYSLAGAILFEMVLLEKLDIKDKRISVKNPVPTGNFVIDETLRLIRKKGNRKKIKRYVNILGSRANRFKKSIIKDLLKHGIIKKVRKKFLGLIPYTRYPEINSKPEKNLRDQLHKIIFGEAKPDERYVMLLSLIDSCKLLRLLYPDKKTHKEARKRIEGITKEFEISEAVSQTIKEVRAAIVASTVSASVVTSSGASG